MKSHLHSKSCSRCGSHNFGSFVQYRRYIVKCLECGNDGSSTHYQSVEPGLKGHYQALTIDAMFNIINVIAEGPMTEVKDVVQTEAAKGKLIWLNARNVS